LATGSGGTGALQFSINGTSFQSAGAFTSLSPGAYTLYVKDDQGCYTSQPVVISATPLPEATAFTIPASCNNKDGSIVLTASGGTAPYSFSLDGIVFQSSNSFSGLGGGFYTLTIRDARGCTNTTGISVSNTAGPVITNAVMS